MKVPGETHKVTLNGMQIEVDAATAEAIRHGKVFFVVQPEAGHPEKIEREGLGKSWRVPVKRHGRPRPMIKAPTTVRPVSGSKVQVKVDPTSGERTVRVIEDSDARKRAQDLIERLEKNSDKLKPGF